MKCPKCSAPLETMPVGGATILSCPGCFGGFYPVGKLTVDIQLLEQKPSGIRCPACESAMSAGTMYEGKIELDQCLRCRGVWLDGGEVQKLRSLAGVDGLIGEAPAARKEQPKKPLDLSRPPKTDDDPPRELLDSSSIANADAISSPVVTLEGRSYKHFQTAVAEVTCALGEFPWQVQVGEQARARDFVSPPYVLSNEITKEDSVWSHGRYLEPSEVWAAFKMDGAPPPRREAGPAQPNPYEDVLSSMWGTFFLAACLIFGGGLAFRSMARHELAFGGQFGYSAVDPEKSRVTPEFELKGRTSNVQVRTSTNFQNQWAYFKMALINAETDQAFDFGREISYYSGSDDEGYWSEGARSDSVTLKAVPPGRYYLRLEPEDGNGSSYSYNVEVWRDVPQAMPVLLALLAVGLPLLLAFFRNRAFEASRWQNSDHPWVTTEDDDE
jgi:Zn-finger nucleic acid-binding protein